MVVRRLALAALAAGVALLLAGCNTSALTKRELVFYFSPNATQAQHQAALDACKDVTPEAVPEPFDTTGPTADLVGDVRFRIDHADDKAIAEVEDCMNKQPGIAGVDIPDLTD
ncbi:MAG TPA: hypothetical protein VHW74_00045 [Mycobacteriales bacterium]|jgi:hypothetical protein|nr:hypothetical protein [Mycobacteriales bacterium]